MNKINIDQDFMFDKIHNINFDKEIINLINSKSSVTGVQKKLSLVFNNSIKKRITGFNSEYIIKPNTKKYPYIAEAEFLNMKLANIVGINTPKFNLIRLKDNTRAFIIKRMDRCSFKKIHMEDFSQLSGRGTEYKYNSSYEFCIKLVKKYSTRSVLDQIELLYRLLFNFLTLNSDMHLKNFSFIEKKKEIYLSPAYDFLPVNVVYPKDTEQVALTLNGKKKNLTYKDFLTFAKNIENGEKILKNLIKKLLSFYEQMVITIDKSLLPLNIKKIYKNELGKRIGVFAKISAKQ